MLLVEWVPARERGTVSSFVYAGTQIGCVLANVLTGLLIADFGGWKGQFYFWAVVSVIWWLLAMVFITSQPKQHWFITEKELAYLEAQIGKCSLKLVVSFLLPGA